MNVTPQPLTEWKTGYVFFTHVAGFVSDGIDYFERWGRLSDVRVSHTGIVTSEAGDIVQAHWRTGVAEARLRDYFRQPKTVVVFRRPAGWSPELGARIAGAARSKVGQPYNKGLIFSQLLANTFCGHWLNRMFRGGPDRWVSARLDRRQAFICSELSAFALWKQREFRGKGILAEPLDTISPQELFEDRAIFEAKEAVEMI